MIWLALLTVLTNGTVQVPASRWTAVRIDVKEPHTVVEATFSVPPEASRMQGLLMTRLDAERFHAGKSHHPLYSTGFQKFAHFRYEVVEPGEYVLLLDNRIEGRSATNVELKIETQPMGPVQPRTLPPEKRILIIALSLSFFLAVAAFTARQFLK